METWVQDALEAAGVAPSTTAPEPIHRRPWSEVWRVRTDDRTLYLKRVRGFTAHEVGVVRWLHGVDNAVLPILAMSDEGGWLLMADAGTRLREALVEERKWDHWQSVLADYARLQAAASGARDELLATGLPDRSPEAAARQFADVVRQAALYRPGEPDGLSDADYQRLLDALPVVEQKAAYLAAGPVPAALNHGDLHDGNIFIRPLGVYAILDWGDASWSHPFFSMRTVYVSAETRFGLAEDAPALDRLRDAYLANWTDYAATPDLLALYATAKALWAVGSSLSWHTAIRAMTSDEQGDYAHVLPSLAQELLGALQT
jgi:hypothetical protein